MLNCMEYVLPLRAKRVMWAQPALPDAERLRFVFFEMLVETSLTTQGLSMVLA